MGQAVVTGGASGIGLATAKALSARDWQVTILDIDVAAGERAAKAGGFRFLRCDMGDVDAIEAVFKTIGPVELLVNNAGISGPTLSVLDMPVAEWKKVLDVNLTGMFVASKCVLPAMIAGKHGIIINMSSISAKHGHAFRSPYGTTKRGILGFTAALAREVGEYNIRVNAILPGPVAGERADRVMAARAETLGISLAEMTQRTASNLALRRFVQPEEIADAVVFLASDSARAITQEFLSVDAGAN